jgi:hypothetical protein
MEKILLQIPLALFMWCLVVLIQGINSKLYLKHYMMKAEQLESELEVLKGEIKIANTRVDGNENIIGRTLTQMVVAHERIDALESELKRMRGDK